MPLNPFHFRDPYVGGVAASKDAISLARAIDIPLGRNVKDDALDGNVDWLGLVLAVVLPQLLRCEDAVARRRQQFGLLGKQLRDAGAAQVSTLLVALVARNATVRVRQRLDTPRLAAVPRSYQLRDEERREDGYQGQPHGRCGRVLEHLHRWAARPDAQHLVRHWQNLPCNLTILHVTNTSATFTVLFLSSFHGRNRRS